MNSKSTNSPPETLFFIEPTESIWPVTIWPPMGFESVSGLSMFTPEPAEHPPKRSVPQASAALISAVKTEAPLTSVTVRHTPSTAILSPGAAP